MPIFSLGQPTTIEQFLYKHNIVHVYVHELKTGSLSLLPHQGEKIMDRFI